LEAHAIADHLETTNDVHTKQKLSIHFAWPVRAKQHLPLMLKEMDSDVFQTEIVVFGVDLSDEIVRNSINACSRLCIAGQVPVTLQFYICYSSILA
jgi:hypothetical protein